MSTDHEQKLANLTRQMRHNQSDLQSFLSDLDSWETDIKKKEENLLSGKTKETSSLPPVRNTIHKKKLKKKRKERVIDPDKQTKKISGYDFRAWDKFDVDAAIEDLDKEEEKKETSSSEYETDEEWEMERKKHLAGLEKEKGNKYFKNEEYDKAIEAYSKGIEFDSTNAVLQANRAMALLKQQKYAAAELDCTTSISLDPLYVKAYLRRATARANLEKHKEAIEDYNRVLDLEPTNKMAQTELERLQKEKERSEKATIPSTFVDSARGLVKAIYKSPEERSKVPLKRIVIDEIGIETAKRNQQSLTEQSEITKKITEMEGKNFEKLLSSKSQIPQSDSSNSINKNLGDRPLSNSKASIEDKSTVKVNGDDIRSSSDKNKNAVNDIASHRRLEEKEDCKIKEGTTKKDDLSTRVSQKDNVASKDPSSPCDHNTSIPGVPSSSFQFQTDFKVLKNKSEAFFKYFTAIDPSKYSSLFGQCLDAEILKTIVKALLAHSQGSDVDIYKVLLGMTNVKRFTMTAMFLSQTEKKGVRDLMDRISSSTLCSQEELIALQKKYDL